MSTKDKPKLAVLRGASAEERKAEIAAGMLEALDGFRAKVAAGDVECFVLAYIQSDGYAHVLEGATASVAEAFGLLGIGQQVLYHSPTGE